MPLQLSPTLSNIQINGWVQKRSLHITHFNSYHFIFTWCTVTGHSHSKLDHVLQSNPVTAAVTITAQSVRWDKLYERRWTVQKSLNSDYSQCPLKSSRKLKETVRHLAELVHSPSPNSERWLLTDNVHVSSSQLTSLTSIARTSRRWPRLSWTTIRGSTPSEKNKAQILHPVQLLNITQNHVLQCFDTVGWAAGRASSL